MRFREPKTMEQLRVGLNGAMIFKLISLVSNGASKGNIKEQRHVCFARSTLQIEY